MALFAYSLAKDGETKLSRNFRVREFACTDRSDPVFIDSELVGLLQAIRDHFGQPVHLTSGYRTAAFNTSLRNAARYSQHLYGRAADIQVENTSVEAVAAYAETLLTDHGGVGRYPANAHRTGWVHLDTRPTRSRWVG